MTNLAYKVKQNIGLAEWLPARPPVKAVRTGTYSGRKTSATDTIKPKGLTLKDLKWKFQIMFSCYL
ncbi:hypothetical protein S225a_07180 [Candidatus Brocadiaceae bacterium S225]|nr:hypothetical protein S225a_07180 [Candidatus Brocadiaceae bacterium S225]